jgi:hypothetical protein
LFLSLVVSLVVAVSCDKGDADRVALYGEVVAEFAVAVHLHFGDSTAIATYEDSVLASRGLSHDDFEQFRREMRETPELYLDVFAHALTYLERRATRDTTRAPTNDG